MSNPYIQYYAQQAGSGLPSFAGVRYQRGSGFWGTLFSRAILPAVKFLGKKALSTGVNVATDVLGGEKLKESLKKRARESGKELANKGISRAKTYLQTGKGLKRKKTIKVKAKKRQKTANFLK